MSAAALLKPACACSHLGNGAGDPLRPLRLDGGGGGARLVVSPRSERAYSHISREFDVLFQALQADAEATRAAAAGPGGGAGGAGAACLPIGALLQLPPAGACLLTCYGQHGSRLRWTLHASGAATHPPARCCSCRLPVREFL